MPRDELPYDPEALEEWRNLPQNKPSRQALPPAAGGTRFAWALLAFTIGIVILGLLSQLGR